MRTALTILLVIALAVAVYFVWQSDWISEFRDVDRLVQVLRESSYAPLIVIGFQTLQVVVFFIPGEITIQVSAGYVFGSWLAFLYSVTGILAGSAFDYTFARIVGRPVVERFLGKETMARVDVALKSTKGRSALFVVYLLPGMPKDALAYGAGLTALRLSEFLLISGLGRAPGLILATMVGSQLGEGKYLEMGITLGIGLLVILALYLYQRRARPAGTKP